ncbi:hypothetical protein HK405_001618, partial [Cladochytrium tenue]
VWDEGTPSGKFESIGGVDCYVANPSESLSPAVYLVLLSDVFGIKLPNIQLVADRHVSILCCGSPKNELLFDKQY